MARLMTRCTIILAIVMLGAFGPHTAAGADSVAPAGAPTPSLPVDTSAGTGIGVNAGDLTSVVSHPFLMFSNLKRAVYVGKERDGDTGQAFKVRLELTACDTAETIAGVKVTVIDATDFADDEVVERARNFYAQHKSGDVYFIAEHIDDYESGKMVGHEGQWVAGENGTRAGILLPAAPKPGDVFETERAPGIAQERCKVVSISRTVKVPAGTFTGCIETEVYDPIDKTTVRRWYCPGAGLVKETGAERVIELASRETR
jgi:hypothetical protein